MDGDVSGGLGATLEFTGATLEDNANIVLPSRKPDPRSAGCGTAQAPALQIANLGSATLDVDGVSEETFFDLTEYTNAGQINLIANKGSVSIGSGALLELSACPAVAMLEPFQSAIPTAG